MKRFLSSTALLASLALVLSLSACDSITELNDNPNAPTEAQIPYLFTNAQTDLAANYYGTFSLGYFGNFYSQYWAHTAYPEEQRYQFPIRRASSNSGIFQDYYFALNDLQEIIRQARQNPDQVSAAGYGNPQDVIAIANIQQVWIWQTLSDIYGPLPYDSTLAGREVVRPPYTSQPDIYRSLVDSLNSAVGNLSADATALGGADVIFGGDTDLWKAFGNGLKMRLAIRASCAGSANDEGNVNCDMSAAPDFAVTAFQEAYNASSFTDMSGYQHALVPFGESQPYVNPIYGNTVIEGRDDWGVSRTLLRVMNENEDPRRPAYANPSPTADATGETYVGLPYGLDAQASAYVGDASRPGACVAETADEPAILYTESEELFMIAEAAQRGWISASAETAYNDAIRASMDYWSGTCENVSISDSEVEAYINSVPYDNSNGWASEFVDGEGVWTQTIGVQKWLAFYMQGVQGWSTWRRLDFDNVFVIPPGNPGQSEFMADAPYRLSFPQEEPALNQANYQLAVEDFLGGEDTQGVPLWWDDQNFGVFLGEAPPPFE